MLRLPGILDALMEVVLLKLSQPKRLVFGPSQSAERDFEANLVQVTEAEAQAMLQKLVVLFGLRGVNLEFDSGACPRLYGCYFASTNTINLNTMNGKVFGYVVAHEFGHALEAAYTGDVGFSYQQGEGFARFMEALYLVTNGEIVDFQPPCGGPLRLLPDGTLQCISDSTQYYAELYPLSQTVPSVAQGGVD
jgi:hypothetical protein